MLDCSTPTRGSLKLASVDPEVDPIVDENMLADTRDMLRMMDAVKRLAVLVVQPALARAWRTGYASPIPI